MNTIRFTQSACGNKVPIINDIPVHSLIDVVSEEKNFIKNNENKIKNSPITFILGLGWGYHVNELIKTHKLNPQNIFVIEDNFELIKEYENEHKFEFNILGISEISEFYNNEEILAILAQKPSFLLHPQSFKSNPVFFRNFLSYRANKSQFNAAEFNLNFDTNSESLNKLEEMILKKNNISKNERIFLTFLELTR